MIKLNFRPDLKPLLSKWWTSAFISAPTTGSVIWSHIVAHMIRLSDVMVVHGAVLNGLMTTRGQLIPHQIDSMRTGVIKQKDDSVRQHSRAFWLYGGSQQPQPPRNEPHLSARLYLPLFPMLDEHTLHYAHLQSNKETTVWTCAF